MDLSKPIIAVLGYKDSGKTTVVEIAIRELVQNRYRVATAKHVHEIDFSIDTEGKDTWRHSGAGANPVAIVSKKETAILIRNRSLSPDFISSLMEHADIIILEGFSSLFLSDDRVGKIFCVRSLEEYKEFKHASRGKIIAFCSHNLLSESHDNQILVIEKDHQILTKRILDYIKEQSEIENTKLE
jgi:molybdopterin-guanine dinucleotide biosynthesis protein B